MKWYYVKNGQQAGPVEETEFAQLIQDGSLRADTLVWREGLANWQPFATACPGQIPPVSGFTPSGNDAVCAECGGIFDKSEMVPYGALHICARCKPVFMQKLAEGSTAHVRPLGSLTIEQIEERDYDVDLAAYLTQAWATFKANAGGMIGASLLVYLAFIAFNIIPYAGILLGFFLTGPLIAGIWIYYIKCARNQSPVIGDAFSGFGPRYWQLVLTQLIPALIGVGMMMSFGLLAALGIPALAAAQRNSTNGVAAPSVFLILGMSVVVLIIALIVTYFSVCWMFALPLAADKGLKFWPAMQLSRRMVRKHWWLTFWLLIVGSIFTMLGALACGVGILVTGPVAFSMWTCHYEKVFGELAPEP